MNSTDDRSRADGPASDKILKIDHGGRITPGLIAAGIAAYGVRLAHVAPYYNKRTHCGCAVGVAALVLAGGDRCAADELYLGDIARHLGRSYDYVYGLSGAFEGADADEEDAVNIEEWRQGRADGAAIAGAFPDAPSWEALRDTPPPCPA